MSNKSDVVKQTMLDGALLLYLALAKDMAEGRLIDLRRFQKAYMDTAHISAMAHQQQDRIAMAMVAEAHKLIVELETGVTKANIIN